ncbi:hypothetical protein EBT31_07860 [bacterium]|nr:hypothetical protein [bacterium]
MKLLASEIKSWMLPAALPAALFGLLTWIYLAPMGTREISWRADESSILIGRPLPDVRTLECTDEQGGCITMRDEPLYMSIIPPAGLWHEMEVEVLYNLKDQQKFELGLMQDFTTQSFVVLPLTPEENQGAWQKGSVTFAVENVQKENGAYKLILSLPGVEEVANKPTIHALNVTFVRNTSVLGEVKWFIKGLWERRP